MEDYSSAIRIREVMQQKGIKAVTLGDMIGMDKGNLNAVISGRRNLTLKTLLSIAQALDVPVTELLTASTQGDNTPSRQDQAVGSQMSFVCPCCGEVIDVTFRHHKKSDTETVGDQPAEE